MDNSQRSIGERLASLDDSSDSDSDDSCETEPYLEPDGNGSIEWLGAVYAGNLLKGIPHGEGVLSRGKVVLYSGYFRSGKFHGLGMATRSDGTTLQCRWKSGKPATNSRSKRSSQLKTGKHRNWSFLAAC